MSGGEQFNVLLRTDLASKKEKRQNDTLIQVSVLSSGALTDFCLNLLRIRMRNLECSVCIGSDSCNTVFLSDNDDLAVLALVANTLVIEILDLFHTVLLSSETISSTQSKKIGL